MCGITQAELKSLLSYNPETGDFTWLVGNKMAGKKAGSAHNKGYLQIRISGKEYLSHRLAWLYVYGEFPPRELDHINGIRNDARISNLREASSRQNKWNIGIKRTNKSGFKGVCWDKNRRKWRAYIAVHGKPTCLGDFATAELASAAYNAKAKEVHGIFYNEKLTH